MPSIEPTPQQSKTYWRSLAERDDLPQFRAFLEAEFPEVADPSGLNRRRWLQVMGASFALAGVAGCEADKQALLPFAKRPPGRTPGKPQQYATAMDVGGSAIGLLATCVDGRPIKIEGNPDHPQSLGATHAWAQAAILELYDPDRSQVPVPPPSQLRGDKWEAFDAAMLEHFGQVRSRQGAGFRVLAQAHSSPTLARLKRELLEQFPEARWYEYEPLHDDLQRQAARDAFGRCVRTHWALDQARIILCVDADLLAGHPESLRLAREFALGREVVDRTMNRLYVVESGYSITGAAADHRLPLRPSQIPALVGRLTEAVRERLAGGQASAPPHEGSSHAEHFVEVLAADLVAHRGQSLVAVGPRQPADVQAAVHHLNGLLENVGKTVRYTQAEDDQRAGHLADIQQLVGEMQSGAVDTLLILGGNPVYNAPADLDFADGLKKVATSIHVGLYRDETARLCRYHAPQAHFLESWGDARSFDGTYSIVQPTIAPLHGGRTGVELLARVLGQPLPDGQQLVRATFASLTGGTLDEKRWQQTLRLGLLAESQWPTQEVPAPPAVTLPSGTLTTSAAGPWELVFGQDASVYDGRFANSGWLQECPDPLTKLTWDNAALVSPATAAALGIADESVIVVRAGERSCRLPVCVIPGQADGTIHVSLGYGRTAAGLVGGLVEQQIDPVGVDTYAFRTTQTMCVVSSVEVERTAGRYRLAVTQDHHAIDTAGMQQRAKVVPQLIREASLNDFLAHPDFAQHVVHHPPLESLWKELPYEGHRWGMAIDLSKCIGCNACVVACQAENNIPVVGKEQIRRGREMHWIRIDRYFTGDAQHSDEVEVAVQPVACHHCELAPCEQVCPVAATVHSDEGLNDMVYNRCIGTRYCGNNCPYKVRRFNYFNYHKELEDANREVSKMMYNPEVTIRSRGVMEKCTYCVQRIQAGKIDAQNRQAPIADGAIRTACQQACPTQAIVFGDLADENAQVARQQQDDRAYAMLAELNVKPRTAYLARIRNPHPDLKPSTGVAHH